jgi:hydroxymethylbilane synthase
LQSHEIRIGTRGSPLALAQAEETRSILAQRLMIAPEAIQIVAMKTTGDRITDRPLAEAGGKGLFTKEIDEALLDGRIDIGVHSAKDMATRLPDGIVIAACLRRQDVRDAFISPIAKRLSDLPEGAVLGTSSLRRRALALRLRPDLRVVDLRGNVDTRLRKIAEGEAQATLLAAAGLTRLGLLDRVASMIEVDQWLPAPGQGAIAISAREDDIVMRQRLSTIDDRTTSIALQVERTYLGVLDGSCRTPIGGLATIDGPQITFRGIIVTPDGFAAHEVTMTAAIADGLRLGREAGEALLKRGGPGFFIRRE